MLDIFKNSAFSTTSLTDAVSSLPFVPGRIRELGLFGTGNVATKTIAIEAKSGVLSLVAPSPRGAPGETRGRQDRTLRNFSIPKFELNDGILADEVQDVRRYGEENVLEQLSNFVAERLAAHVQDMDVTEEHARLGAIKGIVTYKDGSTLNLFTEFGVSQIATQYLDLANKKDGALRAACTAIARLLAAELGGIPYTGIHAFCGDNFFDDLIKNAEVRETYLGYSEARILREGYISPNGKIYSAFEFGGIVWENYRGNSSVGGTFIDADEAHIFPTGVPGLFKTYYGPTDYLDGVNTPPPSRLYARQYEMPNYKGINLDLQMNALQVCLRPRVLIKADRGVSG
jgi:hypothetical protein